MILMKLAQPNSINSYTADSQAHVAVTQQGPRRACRYVGEPLAPSSSSAAAAESVNRCSLAPITGALL